MQERRARTRNFPNTYTRVYLATVELHRRRRPREHVVAKGAQKMHHARPHTHTQQSNRNASTAACAAPTKSPASKLDIHMNKMMLHMYAEFKRERPTGTCARGVHKAGAWLLPPLPPLTPLRPPKTPQRRQLTQHHALQLATHIHTTLGYHHTDLHSRMMSCWVDFLERKGFF